MQESDDTLDLGEDNTAKDGSFEPNPLNQLVDPVTRERMQQAANVAAKLNQQYGAGKMLMGGGVALALAGVALTATKE